VENNRKVKYGRKLKNKKRENGGDKEMAADRLRF
jgi:hypothetical protein